MLAGMNLLSVEVCNDSFGIDDGLAIGVFVGILCIAIAIGLYKMITEIGNFTENTDNIIGVVLAIIVICTTILVPLNVVNHFQFEDYNKYQVTISDDVSFNDVNDCYIVLDQEGKIFTIVERDTRSIKKE